MGLISRFFGRPNEKGKVKGLVANPAIQEPLSLQVLFERELHLKAEDLERELSAFDCETSGARCELDADLAEKGRVLGLAGWKNHVVRLVGFNAPMPSKVVEKCVAPSHYKGEIKKQARDHLAHLLLYYAGYEDYPREQYAVLAAIAGVLSKFGAVVVLNESGMTSLPTAVLDSDGQGRPFDELRRAPLLLLYGGFVKYNVQGVPGVWMRTYGASLLGLPDLAAHAAGHHEGEKWFNAFNTLFEYLLDSGAQFAAGHTCQLSDEEFLRFRTPGPKEKFLKSDATLLIVEAIRPDQVAR